MLHIFNGETTQASFKQSKLPGETMSWKEAFIFGPNPAAVSFDEWIQKRAEHLSEVYGSNLDECKKDLIAQTNQLKKAAHHDEVILWFEFDLFCQLHLIYLLSFFAQQQILPEKLSLVCVNEYPGVKPFYGLGQLYPEQLASLFERRTSVTPDMLKLGHEAWQAFTSADPTDIEKFLTKDTAALPFIKRALTAHLSRFPSTKNGLGYLQNTILDLIASGVDEFAPLLPLFKELNPVFGLGDLQLWHLIWQLNNTVNPLIEIFNLKTKEHPARSRSFEHAYFRLTAMGKAILVGNRDMLNVNHIDYWLGGVHLNHDNLIWRWDVEEKKLFRDD